MHEITRQRMTRRRLLARLPDASSPGATHYRRSGEMPPLDTLRDDVRELLAHAAEDSETGSVLFVRPSDVMLVVPPFSVAQSLDAPHIEPAPLSELLQRDRSVAVLLLRLGGFSVGFFRGEYLADSKTDQRFVKGRHRAGGQSQRRFERIREKQVHELFKKACETAREKLEPYDREIEHVFLGGDRRTLQSFRKECPYFDRFGERLTRRVLPVAGDPRRSSLEAMPREIWSSDVWTVTERPQGEA